MYPGLLGALLPPIQVHSLGAVVCAAAEVEMPANATRDPHKRPDSRRRLITCIGVFLGKSDFLRFYSLLADFECDETFPNVHL
jgi:hypothetical protein